MKESQLVKEYKLMKVIHNLKMPKAQFAKGENRMQRQQSKARNSQRNTLDKVFQRMTEYRSIEVRNNQKRQNRQLPKGENRLQT
jgi:hypothetical protein